MVTSTKQLYKTNNYCIINVIIGKPVTSTKHKRKIHQYCTPPLSHSDTPLNVYQIPHSCTDLLLKHHSFFSNRHSRSTFSNTFLTQKQVKDAQHINVADLQLDVIKLELKYLSASIITLLETNKLSHNIHTSHMLVFNYTYEG